MQLSSKKILYVSFGAFCIGFVVLIFSGGTPLERPLGLFLGGLVMFWIFYFPLIIPDNGNRRTLCNAKLLGKTITKSTN